MRKEAGVLIHYLPPLTGWQVLWGISPPSTSSLPHEWAGHSHTEKGRKRELSAGEPQAGEWAWHQQPLIALISSCVLPGTAASAPVQVPWSQGPSPFEWEGDTHCLPQQTTLRLLIPTFHAVSHVFVMGSSAICQPWRNHVWKITLGSKLSDLSASSLFRWGRVAIDKSIKIIHKFLRAHRFMPWGHRLWAFKIKPGLNHLVSLEWGKNN